MVVTLVELKDIQLPESLKRAGDNYRTQPVTDPVPPPLPANHRRDGTR